MSSPPRRRRERLAPLVDGSTPQRLLLRLLDRTIMPVWALGRDALVSIVERRHRVRTAGILTTEDLDLPPHPEQCAYSPTPWRVLRRALPVDWVRPGDVFIDFGSGMGRVVFQAAVHYPFRRVIGIELSRRLHEIAQANIERNRDRLRCQDVQLVHGDVLHYEVPDDVTVAFFFNPFWGETFATVIDHLLASVDRNPRPLRIVYVSPREHRRLLATGRVQFVKRVRRPRPVREWANRASIHLYDVLPRPAQTGPERRL